MIKHNQIYKFAGVILSPILHGRGAGRGGKGIALYATSCYGYLPLPKKSNDDLKILFVEDVPMKKENQKN